MKKIPFVNTKKPYIQKTTNLHPESSIRDVCTESRLAYKLWCATILSYMPEKDPFNMEFVEDDVMFCPLFVLK